MIRRPYNIIRRFTHNHKPSSENDCSSWYKSEEFKVKINNISNKIDYIHDKAEGAGAIITGCMIGACIGMSVPIVIEVFKRFF